MMSLDQILTPFNIAMLVVLMNVIAFLAFGVDKARAEGGQQRISEATLLDLAFLGGIFGAYAGRRVFRHKTRKQPFSGKLHFIAALQACAAAFALYWFWWRDAGV